MNLIAGKETAFTFEILPPLKGTNTDKLRQTIQKLAEFDPKYINITNHCSEPVYLDAGNGLLMREMVRRRPGTVAVAAALQQEFHIPVVPHILCGGNSAQEIEYLLLDLQFLGIQNIFLLRGDKGKEDKVFKSVEGGYAHATQLVEQVKRFNEGYFVDGTPIKSPGQSFSYGVACYPEKHEEAPNLTTDLSYFKQKVALGAEYGVTQMFFDNKKFFEFVQSARKEGINVPIIPGVKPLTKLSQLTVLPKIFHCDLPVEFTNEAAKCKTDDDMRQVGIEWCIAQCKELKAAGVPSIHFYSNGLADSIYEVAKQVY